MHKTPTRSPLSAKILAKQSVRHDLPTPGGPVIPIDWTGEIDNTVSDETYFELFLDENIND